ncbi:MAG: hypothetical protein A2817_02665 [Candidatus Yanofskybacteria bacterium RIFCSPHIGHO2_01_FULL_39_8b]|uniref:Glycoside hydrolase family 42 N-terminal domain-containing protein n=1 Tax=Candidatus Yanofskybacteria bacterium RIFCSPHIGHO2_01_FULL_39_8b TaxID=1802659 RepID=A0A1F8EHE3_9BACT|nr:MAG: hypothetical protein A2817_02665 [Candidatus Yanofskybacteria bacterium RIFCSPHIGHO2_01_FULL_39_8b]
MRRLIIATIILGLFLFLLSLNFKQHEKFMYGVSFSRFHSDELGLDWKETYLAILNDLGVRNFRFSAHWSLTEPEEGKYNFEELDFQMEEAKKAGASVILAVGRRLPGWPECHVPDWLKANQEQLSTVNNQLTTEGQEKLLRYIETVVNRYKNYENIKYWQVENEPYLTFFSKQTCGAFDEDFLKNEIALVKKLDSVRPILTTDSGEFGLWYKAYQRGDVFGTSMYLYVWNRIIGPFRYPITPAFFRIKKNITSIIYGNKPSIVIELSAEPWLLKPITDTPLEVQLSRMGIDKFNEMIKFSEKTGFDTFYLWGAEWWYWMKLKDHSEFWDRAKKLVISETQSQKSYEQSGLSETVSESLFSSVGIQVFRNNKLIKQGSGIIISSDGLIATVADLFVPNAIYQIFYDDKILKGIVAAKNQNRNLILIKTDNEYSKIVNLNSTDYKNGQEVALIGRLVNFTESKVFSQKGEISYITSQNIAINTKVDNNLYGAGVVDTSGNLGGLAYLRKGKVKIVESDSIKKFFEEYAGRK